MLLSFRRIEYLDISLLRSWRNNPAIYRWCRQNDLISEIDQENWYERQNDDPGVKMYGIKKPSGELVGVCGFTGIDWIARKAEFSLYIAPEYQNQGFGRIALEQLLELGFRGFNFHLIWGEVIEGNHAMLLFRALGFIDEGIRRDFYFKDGDYQNATIISLRRQEWMASHPCS